MTARSVKVKLQDPMDTLMKKLLTKGGKFSEELSDYQLLKKGCAPWNL